jgi:hypothetical protein
MILKQIFVLLSFLSFIILVMFVHHRWNNGYPSVIAASSQIVGIGYPGKKTWVTSIIVVENGIFNDLDVSKPGYRESLRIEMPSKEMKIIGHRLTINNNTYDIKDSVVLVYDDAILISKNVDHFKTAYDDLLLGGHEMSWSMIPNQPRASNKLIQEGGPDIRQIGLRRSALGRLSRSTPDSPDIGPADL